MRTAVAIVALLVGAGACAIDEQGELLLPQGDQASFAATVQPVIAESCGSLDCHGDFGRPLRLYAQRGLRLSGALRGQPITPEEIGLNTTALAAIDPGTTDDTHLALAKPLAESAGGYAHVGGDLWDAPTAAGYQALKTWLASLE